MADLVDRLQQDQSRQDNQDLAAANHDMQWSNTFASTPAPEVLRDRVNYADTVNRVLTNRLALQAQSDNKALELLGNQQKLAEWQQNAPLRQELLQRKVDSEGAHERFLQQKDSEAMRDTAGFLKAIGSVTASPGTPEYQSSLNQALQDNPRILGTQAGMDVFKKLQKEHQDISAITPPPGTEVSHIEIGDDGRAKAVFKPVAVKPTPAAIPDNLQPTGAHQKANGEVVIDYGTPKTAADKTGTQIEKEMALHQSAYDKASQRRISAGKQLAAAGADAAKLKIANDVVAAADADILAAKAGMAAAQAKLAAPATTSTNSGFSDPDAVKTAYKAGQLSKDEAATILRNQFGHQ